METLLGVRHLTKHFPRQSGVWGDRHSVVRAVEDVTFDIGEGESLGLVGESGSGKSTTGRLILRLIDATYGEISFRGKAIQNLGKHEMRALRREMQIVFQDPYGAFNPRMSVGAILGEALELRGLRSRAERDAEVARLLELVQMPPEIASRFPHEFSGGQRQRIGIARALAVEPKFVVLDEPLSALDVSTQAEIINLLLDLQTRLQLTTLFISHDLSVVRVMCDRVAVMFAGRILELAPATGLFQNPLQPYTQELLAAVPVADPQLARRTTAEKSGTAAGAAAADAASGNDCAEPAITSDATPITAANVQSSEQGCPYAERCPHVMDICRKEMPPLVDYAAPLGESAPHFAACHWVQMRLTPTENTALKTPVPKAPALEATAQ